MVPGSPALVGHPKNVYLPEVPVLTTVNDWLGGLFDPANVDQTVRDLVGSQDDGGQSVTWEAANVRLAKAEARLRRLQTAIEAGVEPAALVEGINAAQAQRTAARAELANLVQGRAVPAAEVYAVIDALCDVRRTLNSADPARLEDLYAALRLDMVYDAEARAVDVTIRPAGRDNECVRGGT
jgi:hypothetical protein